MLAVMFVLLLLLLLLVMVIDSTTALTIRRSATGGDSGVTSLLSWDDQTMVVGTKNGTVHLVHGDGMHSSGHLSLARSKFPIYSLCCAKAKDPTNATTATTSFLFCGGGDRWVSVWQRTTDSRDSNYESFRFVQKLGPHTGWVKDVLYDTSNGLLHSIGCNCIETWTWSRPRKAKEAFAMMTHLTKRSIENDPDVRATLSSDLLCLACIPTGSYLVSGGVDGRIHLWSSNPLDGGDPLDVVIAHDERVNALIYSSSLQLLFSASNDGRVKAFAISSNMLRHVTTINISDSVSTGGTTRRLTSVLFLDDKAKKSSGRLVLGSSQGDITILDVALAPASDSIILSVVDTTSFALQEPSVVYALAHNMTLLTLWVGHAKGLAIVDMIPK